MGMVGQWTSPGSCLIQWLMGAGVPIPRLSRSLGRITLSRVFIQILSVPSKIKPQLCTVRTCWVSNPVFSNSVLLPLLPPVSWDYLPNKLLALKPLAQSLFWGKLNCTPTGSHAYAFRCWWWSHTGLGISNCSLLITTPHQKRRKGLHIIQRLDTINTLLFGSWGRLSSNPLNKVLIAATPGRFLLKAIPYFPFQIPSSLKGQWFAYKNHPICLNLKKSSF